MEFHSEKINFNFVIAGISKRKILRIFFYSTKLLEVFLFGKYLLGVQGFNPIFLKFFFVRLSMILRFFYEILSLGFSKDIFWPSLDSFLLVLHSIFSI